MPKYQCSGIVLALLTAAAAAIDGQEPVQVQVGQPTLWTLEQAHYLLAQQRLDNQGLGTARPTTDDLKDDTKESYAFKVNKVGDITFEPKTRVL